MDTINNPTITSPTPSSARRGIKPETPDSPYTPILERLGLNKNEAQIYELLLNTGPQGMKPILFHTKLKRGNAYYHLDNLAAKGLVEKQDLPGQTTKFIAKNPEQLELLVAKQKAAVFSAAEELTKNLPQLRSLFQLAAIKPEIKFYEGLDGIKKVLEDTLLDNPQKELLVFSDVAGYSAVLDDWNTNYYAPKRKSLKIFEKSIVPNSPKALEWLKNYQANDITDTVFTDYKLFPFNVEINIYNNKVSFVTFSQNKQLGVLIENKEIYNTLRSVFNLVWDLGKKHLPAIQPAWFRQLKRSP